MPHVRVVSLRPKGSESYFSEPFMLHKNHLTERMCESLNGLSKEYFADYDAFTENEILEVTPNGISLRNGTFIDFSACVQNFQKAYPNYNGRCVGERDITEWSFTFYSNPKPILIQFIAKNRLMEFFSANNTMKRFHSFQFQIYKLGYTTFDMS